MLLIRNYCFQLDLQLYQSIGKSSLTFEAISRIISTTTKLSENNTRDNVQGISRNLWQTIITYFEITMSIAIRTEDSGKNMYLK